MYRGRETRGNKGNYTRYISKAKGIVKTRGSQYVLKKIHRGT